MFDLAALDTRSSCNAGIDVDIMHPAKRVPLGIIMHVIGMDGDVYRKSLREVQVRRLNGARHTPPSEALDAGEADRIEVLSRCIVSWRSLEKDVWTATVKFNGRDYECNAENAAMLMTQLPWLREQIILAVEDRANFLKD